MNSKKSGRPRVVVFNGNESGEFQSHKITKIGR